MTGRVLDEVLRVASSSDSRRRNVSTVVDGESCERLSSFCLESPERGAAVNIAPANHTRATWSCLGSLPVIMAEQREMGLDLTFADFFLLTLCTG